MAQALLDLAAAIDAGIIVPAALASLVRPFAVETQMGRLFAAHAELSQGSESASRA